MSSTTSPAEASQSSAVSGEKDLPSFPRPVYLKVLEKLDEYIRRLHYCISSRAGTDTVLLYLLYATKLLSNLLDHVGNVTLAIKSTSLYKRTHYIKKAIALLATSVVRLGQSSKAVLGMLAEVRAFGRLWGVLGLYVASKKLIQNATASTAVSKEEKSRKDVDTIISGAQLLFLFGYYAPDNIYYLSGRKVIHVSPARRDKLAKLSIYSWTLYVIVDLAKLIIQRGRAEKDGTLTKNWRDNFLQSLAWFPIALNYCVENGPINDTTLSLLAYYPCAAGMQDLWLQSSSIKTQAA